MKHYAITGNMGSGKSTVCTFFECLEIPVYYSDQQAKRLMHENINLKKNIQNLLGKNAYDSDGQLNRAHVGKQIFNDSSLLSKMNSIVHPAVRDDYLSWRGVQKSKFTLQESALTFEIQAEKIMDGVLLVYAEEELLIARSMKRNGQTREQVMARLHTQMSQEEKLIKADFIIYNSLGHCLTKQITNIYRKILKG